VERPLQTDHSRDANEQALVYIYSRGNDAEALQAKVLTPAARPSTVAFRLGARNGRALGMLAGAGIAAADASLS
jgi:hypothetical protein